MTGIGERETKCRGKPKLTLLFVALVELGPSQFQEPS